MFKGGIQATGKIGASADPVIAGAAVTSSFYNTSYFGPVKLWQGGGQLACWPSPVTLASSIFSNHTVRVNRSQTSSAEVQVS